MNLIPFIILLIIFSGDNRQTDHSDNGVLSFSEALDKTIAVSNALTKGKGISAAVIIEGTGKWEGADGHSSIDQPIDSDMLFDVASIGKTFLAMLILKLVEEGTLSLDDSISDWLTGYNYIDGSVTIRQLLNHTSGIFNWVEHQDSPYRIPYDNINFSEISSSEIVLYNFVGDPYFKSGEGFYYSTTNYNILKIIAQKVTGNRIGSDICKRFLVPLGLENTFILDSLYELPGSARIVHPWWDTDHDGIPDDISNRDINWIASRSPCFVYSTASNLAEWIHSIFNHKVIRDSLNTKILDFYRPTPSAPGAPLAKGYGLGIQELRIGTLTMYGHLGWEYGQTSSMLYIPRQSASVVVLINDNNMFLINMATIALISVIEFHLHPGHSFLILTCWLVLLSLCIYLPLAFLAKLILKRKKKYPVYKPSRLKKASLSLILISLTNGIIFGIGTILYLINPFYIISITGWSVSSPINKVQVSLLLISVIASISLLYIIFNAWRKDVAPFRYKFYFTIVIFSEIFLIGRQLYILFG